MPKYTPKSHIKLGKRIQKYRKNAGFTQETLAERLNISRAHIGHIEQARKSPSFDLLEKIAKSLKINLKDLFD